MKAAIAILVYGRPDSCKTYDTLAGRTDLPIYIYASDDDKALESYKNRFDNVVVFHKEDLEGTFDRGTNERYFNHPVFARNFIIRDLYAKGYDYVIMCDDDIEGFTFRYPEGGSLKGRKVENIDSAFTNIIGFMDSSDRIVCCGPRFSADMFGVGSYNTKPWVCMCLIVKLSKQLVVNGRSEDLRISLDYAPEGYITMAFPQLVMSAEKMGTGEGGIAYDNVYKLYGSLVTVCPSAISITFDGKNMTHSRQQRFIFPKLISENHKKS